MTIYDFDNIKDNVSNLLETDVIKISYTGSKQEITLPAGKYKLKLWGAKGGADAGGDGCSGGYSEGILTLYEPTKLFIYLGGQGKGAATGTGGGFNGGGNAGTSGNSGAGGGASDIRLREDSLYARVIVAGGGAGSGITAASITNYGWGGGLEGGPNNAGQYATQTSGYSFGQGQDRLGDGGGGGGGWYGGYSATADHSGSGGSGYVYTKETAVNYPEGCLLRTTDYLENARTIAGNEDMPIPSITDEEGNVQTGNRGDGCIYFYVREIAGTRKNSNIYKNSKPQDVYELSSFTQDISESKNTISVKQSNHELSVGNVVYLKSDGSYDKAFGEDSERIEVVGIVTKVIDKNNFTITVSGEFKTDIYDSYSNGTVLYLSDSDVGLLTDIPTTYIKPIGIKISSGILINIQRANVYSNYGLENETYYTSEEIINAIDDLW